MWEISNTLQAVDFLRAAVLGIILCIFYGLFSSLRKIGVNSDFEVFFEDIIFFMVSSPVVFMFLLATTNGELRLYIIIGLLLGFASFKFTFYRIYVFLLSKIFTSFVFVISYLRKIFFKFIDIVSEIFYKIGKKFKKALNTLKKGLKKQH